MSGGGPATGVKGPSVRVVTLSGAPAPVRRVTAGRSTKKSGSRAKVWIVRSVMIATTLFAFLDLTLLASGGHH
jgi:hypothetical protein